MKFISTLFLSFMALLALPLAAIAQDAVFDFENNTMGLPVGEGQTFTDGALNSPVTVGDVTLTSVQGEAFYPAIMMKDNKGVITLNVYKNGAIKLNAAEGKALVKVAATMKGTKVFSQMTASTGAITENTWEGNATEVTFTASALMSFLKVEVTMAAKNDETVEPVVETFDMEVDNIGAFRAAEDGKMIKLALKDVQVNAIDDIFNFAYVEDATGAIEISGIALTAGTKLNGYIIGTKSSDNLDYSDPDFGQEVKLSASSDDTFTAEAIDLVATPVEIASIASAENHGRLMTISNVEIKKEGRFYYAYQGEDKVQVKDAFGVLPADYEWPEKAKSITGLVTFNGARFQIAPLEVEDIAIEMAGEIAALFDFANNNGQWSVGTSEDTNAGNLEGVALSMNDITLTFVSSPTMPTRYYINGERGPQLQLIKGGQMRLTAKEGYAITAVQMTPNKTTNATTGAEVVNVNWTVDKGEGALSADKLSWTGNATSIRFNATGPTYINSIEVTMVPADEATVTPEADAYTSFPESLAEFNALADGTPAILTLKDAVVTAGMVNEWGFYLQDATAGAHFYCTGLSYPVGTKLNGKVWVKKSNQTMGSRIAMTEETNGDNLTATDDGTYDAVTGMISEVNVAANILKVVKLTEVAVKGTKNTEATITDAAGSTLTINNGKNNYFPYIYQTDLTTIDYQNAIVEGILLGGNKLIPFSITEQEDNGIVEAFAINQNDITIYNMQGMRQKSLQHGLNIVNGKKIIVK